jgi:hypothetical protein
MLHSRVPTSMKKATVLVLLVVGMLLVPAPVLALVEGQPAISVDLADNRVTAGEVTTLELTVQNKGKVERSSNPSLNPQVTTANGVRVQLRSGDAPLSVKTGTQAIGSLPTSARNVPFQVVVDEDAEPGTYTLRGEVRYSYTELLDPASGTSQSEDDVKDFTVKVVVEEEPRFDIVETSTGLAVGDSGPVTVTLVNNGTETASDAAVTVRSSNDELTFAGSKTARSFVGDWEPGETRTLTYKGSIADGAELRPYSLNASVTYEDAEGVPGRSEGLEFGVTPAAEQTFDVENAESTLRVGAEGQVTGEVVNTGPATASNAVVVLSTDNANLDVRETEFAIGDLGSGERASFAFDVEVTDSAEAGPRQFEVTVEYRNGDDDQRTSDPLDLQANVGEQRDEFVVSPVNATFAAGSSGQLELEVTNNGEEPVRDISAKLFVDSPVSVSDDEAFIGELAPGETRTVTFGVGVGGSAIAKAYPVELDFQYDTAEGETLVSDTYKVPIEVTESERGSGLPLPLVGGVLLLVLLGVGGFVYMRR